MKLKRRYGLTLAIILVLLISTVVAVPKIGFGAESHLERVMDKTNPDDPKIDSETVDLEEGEKVLKDDYEKHEPIHIKGNENFTEVAEKEGWTGSGTENDPYIIEGYEIKTEEIYLPIKIKQVNLHFKIINNHISTRYGDGEGVAIKFIQSKNGDIVNNTIETNGYGIHLDESRNNLVRDNDLFKTPSDESGNGIFIAGWSDTVGSSNNTVEQNRIVGFGFGIRIHSSEYNIVRNNTVSKGGIGIKLEKEGDHNSIIGNIMDVKSDGVWIYESSNCTFINNTFMGAVFGLCMGRENPFVPTSNDNLIYNNNFIENEQPVCDLGDNQYYNKSLGIGNYWSDYEEKYPDAEKKNGVWDTPYRDVSGDGFTDKYPMVEPSVPYIQIDRPDDGMRTNQRNVTVSWTTRYRYKDELNYEVKVDETGWRNVGETTSHTIKELSAGKHSFEVRTADGALDSVGGNIEFTVLSSNITVNDFAVEPLEGKKPLEVNVSANLENEGNSQGNISLYVDGKDRKTWSLKSWEWTVVKESIEFEEAGTYLVGIGNKSAEVTVRRPKPEFSVDEFSVEPDEGKSPLKVDISAEVINTGDAKGEIYLYLKDQKLRSWTLEPGENVSIEESFELSEPGNYTVRLGDKSTEVRVDNTPENTPVRLFALVGVIAVVVMGLNIYYLRSKDEE